MGTYGLRGMAQEVYSRALQQQYAGQASGLAGLGAVTATPSYVREKTFIEELQEEINGWLD